MKRKKVKKVFNEVYPPLQIKGKLESDDYEILLAPIVEMHPLACSKAKYDCCIDPFEELIDVIGVVMSLI